MKTMMKVVFLLMLMHCIVCGTCAQTLTASNVRAGEGPLSLIASSAIAQPIRMYTGANGTLLSLEAGSMGDVSIPMRLGIGTGVGAAIMERLRVGSVDSTGIVIDMIGTSASTGLLIDDVGLTGTDHAGIVIAAASNGYGTGLRIGGPAGGTIATLGTGVDITGGTGLRYNALTAGSGTAIEVGFTTPPLRGISVAVAGAGAVGGTFRTNTNGTAVVGLAQSAAYADPPHVAGVAVRGYAATNSNVATEEIIGVLGTVVRGGSGGTNTTSSGIVGRADGQATAHGGLVIGVLGAASTAGNGTTGSIGGFFSTPRYAFNLSLAVKGGDVYLGSTDQDRPPGFPSSFINGLGSGNHTTTRMYDARISGALVMRGTGTGTTRIVAGRTGSLDAIYALPASMPLAGDVLMAGALDGDTARLAWKSGTSFLPVATLAALPQGAIDPIDPGNASVLRLTASPVGSFVSGFAGGYDGRVITLLVQAGSCVIVNDDPAAPAAQRILTGQAGLELIGPAATMLMYDAEMQRWRMLSYIP